MPPLKKKIIFIMSLFIILNSNVMAQQWEESYDPNTEVVIKGKIVEISSRAKGPVVLGIIKQNRIYYIITAPRWYFDEEKINLRVGDEIVVHGAKFFSHKGEFFLIARSIHNISDGKIYSLRDQFFKPCWRGKDRFNLQ